MTNKTISMYGDMTLIQSRLDLVNLYKRCAGLTGSHLTDVEACFVNGEMGQSEALSYVRLTEYVIAQMASGLDHG